MLNQSQSKLSQWWERVDRKSSPETQGRPPHLFPPRPPPPAKGPASYQMALASPAWGGRAAEGGGGLVPAPGNLVTAAARPSA